jgi:hypothetical protein
MTKAFETALGRDSKDLAPEKEVMCGGNGRIIVLV